MFFVVELFLLILPAYIANSVPVVFGGGQSIDFGKKFVDGKPVFGKSKTIRGLASGIVLGSVAGIAIATFAGSFYLASLAVNQKILLGVMLPLGAMAGDLIGSFVKRRLSIPSGKPSLVLDQLFFLFVALLFGVLAFNELQYFIKWSGLVFLIVLTYVLHAFFNALAHKLKLKNVPW